MFEAFSQSIDFIASPLEFRDKGVFALSGDLMGFKASQPFGQAIPRLTGYSLFGDKLTAFPSLIWREREQPTEQ